MGMNKIAVLHCGLICLVLLATGCFADPTPDVSFIIKAQSSPLIYIKQSLMSIQRALQQLNGEKALNVEVLVALSSTSRYDALDSLIATLKTQDNNVPITLLEPNSTETVVTILNKAASLARAPYLLFLDETVELLTIESVHSLLNAFTDQQDSLGQLGCKVISSDDRSVHRAGIEFVMAHNPSKNRFSSLVWSNTASNEAEEPEDVPIIFHRYEGYSAMDTRTLVAGEVPAVSADCMMIPRELFMTAGKFNESYLNHYFDADLSQRLIRNLTKKVKFHPSAVMMFNEDSISDTSRDDDLEHSNTKRDLTVFQNNYGSVLQQEITDHYQVKNFTVVWSMECGTGQVLGFTTEATGFLMGLSSKLRVKIKVNNMDECKEELKKIGLPVSTRKIMAQLMQGEYRSKGGFALVIHRDPGRTYSFFKNSLSYNEEPDYVIGRSMYETDTIPNGWAEQCNDEVDEIWVPSRFNVETFSKAGVNSSKLFVVPESIDTNHYNPTIHKPLRELANSHKFKYLAVGKWEKRKAWNLLLPTYFELFKTGSQHHGNVELIVRARMDEESKLEYEQIVQKYINESGAELSTLPPVRFLDTLLPYMRMPSLYKSVDCFVLPSHGEGWGLPYMEAMSMQVPTIGTNWSGNTEFMNNENSYLIDVEKMDDATEEGHKWATVSQTHLREQMSKCLEDRADAQQRAAAARSSVVANFDIHSSAQKAIERLLEIQVKLPQIKASRPQQTSTSRFNNFGNQESTPRGATEHSWQRYRNRQPVGATTFNTSPSILPPRTDGKTRIKIIE